MQIHTYNNRRIIQHTDNHYDIEELRTDSDGNSVWAVIFCSEDEMYNGWTPSTPIKTRVMNLVEQIPTEYRNRAVAECVDANPHDFERALTGYVLSRVWETYEHPVNEAEFTDVWSYENNTVDTGLNDDRPYRPASEAGNFPF